MKFITMFVVIAMIFLYSCTNAKANTAEELNDKKINENFYFDVNNAYNYIKAQSISAPYCSKKRMNATI